ncbi:MAG TPA: ATP-binding protein [Gemmatimonadaceae bacterium]|nr:ATP-binding protein [Gemmatimonadaceae bacterium]
MASIRARITATYAVALAGTMFAFSVAVGYERNKVATDALYERASSNALLAARILQQARQAGEQIAIDTAVLVGSQIAPRLRGYLDALPGFVFVLDSNRVLYASPSVQRLWRSDLDRLTTAAFDVDSTRQSWVTLDSLLDRVLLAGGYTVPKAVGGVRRVVAGVSSRSGGVSSAPVFVLTVVIGPLILLVSVGTAWLLAGRMLSPIEHMVNDVEAITDGRSLHRRVPVEDLGDEIGRLGETLNAMIQRLEASFAALRRFTADASHELRTPLAVLRADIERAMTAPPRGTEQLVALEEALQETSRMTGLVESLLTLARADEGRLGLQREPVALEALVKDVGETAHILGEEAGLTVSTPLLQPVTVLGDAERLRQLFLNLVTNAIKYTPRGGSVELSLEARDGTAVFTVKDTGVGIAGADLPYIFDRFWRVDRARSRLDERGGVGLGLAIAQWITQAHGGSINVASRLGRGSTFAVTIPALAPPIEA